MSAERRTRSTEAFFGRRRGKTIRPLQARALAGLDALRLDLAAPCPADPRALFAVSVDRVRIEIGFGGGEHLHHEAGRHPTSGFIGIEPFVNGMAKLLVLLDAEPRDNLRLHDDDAVRVLDWLPPASIDGIDLFYPDPWPKARHHKRRFVNAANLDRFARVLKLGGVFRFASDIAHYVDWTASRLGAHGAFEPAGRDVTTPYPGWPGTRYEAKALREGRTPAWLEYWRG